MFYQLPTHEEMIAIKLHGSHPSMPYEKPLRNVFVTRLGCTEERAEELVHMSRLHIRLAAHIYNISEI